MISDLLDRLKWAWRDITGWLPCLGRSESTFSGYYCCKRRRGHSGGCRFNRPGR